MATAVSTQSMRCWWLSPTGAPWSPDCDWGRGLVVAWNGWQLLLQAGAHSLDALPAEVNLQVVKQIRLVIDRICDLHQVHVWSYSTGKVALTAYRCRRHGDGDDKPVHL